MPMLLLHQDSGLSESRKLKALEDFLLQEGMHNKCVSGLLSKLRV